MNIYELAYLWHEDYRPKLLISDKVLTEQEWGELCDSLLNESVERAIILASRNPDFLTWVGWDTIVEAMVGLLQKQGFRVLKPIAKSYWGTTIIDDAPREGEAWLPDSVRQKMIAHNEAARKQ